MTAYGFGKKVFVNVAGFLPIRQSGQVASSSQFTNLLDDTRIHSEYYGLARELANEGYKWDTEGDMDGREMSATPMTLLSEITTKRLPLGNGSTLRSRPPL